MIEVKVVNVAIDMKSNMPVIILKEKEGNKTLPIWVGLFEAQAIALALENVKPPRPLTHDLTKSIIEKLKGKVDKVAVGSKPIDEKEVEEFKKKLRDLKPEDFAP